MKRRQGSEGLTLIEMLVVLAIIGVMSSLVVIGLGTGAKEQNVQAEAQRLALSLQAASDEALTSDIPVIFQWDEKGYGLSPLRPKTDATEEAVSPAPQGYKFPDAVTLSASGGESPVRLGDPGVPSLAFVLTSQGRRWRVDYDGLNAVAAPDA